LMVKNKQSRFCHLIGLPAIILLQGLLVCPAAFTQDSTPCTEADQDCLQQLYATHPARSIRSWQAIQALPLERRIMRAPNRLIEFLKIDNQLHGFPNHPRAAKIPRKFLKGLKAAIAELPAEVITLIDRRLMGIFLVEDLGGTGMTDYVFNDEGKAVGGYVVLDVGVLSLPANQWATWKENTPFIAEPEYVIRARIETDLDNNLKQALQYILLHEFGHIASIGAGIHPPWSDWNCQVDPPAQYPFFELSWQLSGEENCAVVSKFDASVFSYRTDVIYYFGARLQASVSPVVYEQLEQTNFPSLYAATSPYDDFAESFVSWVHQKMMHKPFEIQISRKEQYLTEFRGCWNTPRCAAKKQILTELLSDAHANP